MSLKPRPELIGFAGLIPALFCLWAVLLGGTEWRFIGLAAGYGYVAIIFSFVGGAWWGLAAAALQERSGVLGWIYIVSIMPALIGFALYLPWVFAVEWPGPSLIWLGLAVILSPLVDLSLTREKLAPAWWMGLRLPLSAGLGGAAVVMGLAA